MKSRTEEYLALTRELSRPPTALEGSVQRARKRAKRIGLVRRFAAPAASLAAAAACFVLLVNVFPSFALACSGVPIIRELTAAVAFSPSLSAAVAHDYVQYIGQSRTVDGVTVDLEYAIVDKHQAVFFYSVDGTPARFYTSPSITAPDGEAVGGYAVSSSHWDFGETDELRSMTLSFIGGENSLPNRFTLEMYFQPMPQQDQMSAPAAPDASVLADGQEYEDPRDDPNTLRFAFDVALDPARISEGKTVEVGRWVQLDGQRVLVDRLELFPTRTILCLGEDEGNTAWLRTLKFWFEDGDGNRYDNTDGTVSASGAEDIGSRSMLTYYFQSFYYSRPERLTLCIQRAQWLDKDAPHICLDLTTGACPGLPEGVRVDGITREGETVTAKFLLPLEQEEFGQLFMGSYWDPDGGEHSFNRWSGGDECNEAGERIAMFERLYFTDYLWDTVELELSYTGISQHDPAVRVPLFG